MSESIGGIGGLDLKHQIAPRGTCGFSDFRACQEKEKEKEKDKKKKKKFLGKAGKVGLINEDEAHFFWMKITLTDCEQHLPSSSIFHLGVNTLNHEIFRKAKILRSI